MNAVDPAEAARQLAGVEQTNAEMARRASAPWWYHVALGLLIGGFIATLALPVVWRAVYFAVAAGGLAALVQVYRKRTGVWVNGYRKGRTRTVSLALTAAIMVIGLGSVALARGLETPWIYLAAGVLVAALASGAGWAWEAAFRHDLAEDRA